MREPCKLALPLARAGTQHAERRRQLRLRRARLVHGSFRQVGEHDAITYATTSGRFLYTTLRMRTNVDVLDSRLVRWLLAALMLGIAGACGAAGRSAHADVSTKTTVPSAATRAEPATACTTATAQLATAGATPSKPPATANAPSSATSGTADLAAPHAISGTLAPPQAPPTPVVMPDIDYWATPQSVVDKMLELAQIKQSDVVYDLGCGDARSLVSAAKRFGARGVGVDIDPRVVALARENVRRNGVEQLVTIEQANIFTLDLSPADVIFLYITQRFNLRLVPQFKKMRNGSRIVAHEFEIPGAKPIRTLRVLGPPDGPADAPPEVTNDASVWHTIYLWKIPWQKQWTDWK